MSIEKKLNATPTNWRGREQARLDSGKYKPVPWAKEPWFAALPEADPRRDHFVHISERDPWMLAYTPTPSDGERARIFPIKPGRYLQKFFAGALTPEQVKHFASQVRGSGFKIVYLRDAPAIQKAYQTSGLTACMSYSASHYRCAGHNGGLHPTAAYSESDLALAVAHRPEDGAPIARALVWSERKLYSRAYGDHEAMNKALQAEGYAYGLLDGAALRCIPLQSIPNHFTCPYIDHVKWARLEGERLVLQCAATGATHSVQHGDGIAYPIANAPQRPAGATDESIAQEHARLCALEAGKPEPKAEPKKAAPQEGARQWIPLNTVGAVVDRQMFNYIVLGNVVVAGRPE